MTNIQGPVSNSGQNYGATPYGGSSYGNSYGGSDPMGGAGQSGQVQAYIQYMHQYEQMLLSWKQTHMNDPQAVALVDQYLSTSQQYLQQVGDWDPMGGIMSGGYGMGDFGGMGVPGADPMGGPASMDQTGQVIWGDQTRIKYDGADPASVTVNLQDNDLRQKEFFQENLTIRIPFHASGKEELLDDDSAPAPAKMLKVTVTLPDGSSRVYIKHNLKATDQVQILSADGDATKFVQDASLSSTPLAAAVTVGKVGSDDPSMNAGDPPTKMDGDTRVYDGTDFNISPVAGGSDKKTRVAARGEVTITPNSNEEYYRMDYDATTKKYTVKVYANDDDYKKGKIKETIEIDGALVKKVHFAGDKSRIDFGNMSKVGSSSSTSSSTGLGSSIFVSRNHVSNVIRAVTGANSSPTGPVLDLGNSGSGGGSPSSPVAASEPVDPSHQLDSSKPGASKVDVVGDPTASGTGGVGRPVNPVTTEDNIPDAVDKGVAVYDGSSGQDQSNVSIHTYFDNPLTVKEHDIYTAGDVTIFASSYRDKVVVTRDQDGRYRVVVQKNGDPKTAVTYLIVGDVKHIKIKGTLTSNVDNQVQGIVGTNTVHHDSGLLGGLGSYDTQEPAYGPDPKILVGDDK